MTAKIRSKAGRLPEDLESIPGIGPSMAADLRSLGIAKVCDLKGKDPELLYRSLEAMYGGHIDRCVLYSFRCAAYFADGGREEEKLKWWNWKGFEIKPRK